jgi:FtsP/CotA-like multicopper oxidase with cupredoxin domain
MSNLQSRVVFTFLIGAALFATCASPSQAAVRTYYIAADEVVWNYAPSGHNGITHKLLGPVAPGQIGWAYKKATYRAYTDATFRHLAPRAPADRYLGLIGPVIRAEVGDTIKVVFRNNTTLHLGVHAHGVLYKKDSEGAPYLDGTSGKDKADDSVRPGRTYTYTWEVPARAGPGPMDDSSVLWMYHSHTDEVNDVNTGLVGPIVVTAQGMANPDGTPKGVDAEVFTMFSEMDESLSRLLPQTLADKALNPHGIKASLPGFQNFNQIFSINGFVFGNMPTITLKVGEHVRWYVFASMSDFDFHSPDWHGQTVIANGNRTNVIQLGPMQMSVVDMVPDNVGTWLFNCDINVHYDAGMQALFRVVQ